MHKSVLVLVALGALLTVAGGAIAPTVCVNAQAMANLLLAFASDPTPDLILAPGALVDALLVCPA